MLAHIMLQLTRGRMKSKRNARYVGHEKKKITKERNVSRKTASELSLK